MKIAAIADVHNQWKEVKPLPADILVVAGDITIDGYKHEFKEFFQFLKGVKNTYDEVIVVAGTTTGGFLNAWEQGENGFVSS